MLLSNMQAGVFQKEKALHQLGMKFDLIEDPDKAPVKKEETKEPSFFITEDECDAEPVISNYGRTKPSAAATKPTMPV